MSILENYEPKKVLKYFEEICAIPHASFHTDKISDYLVDFAKSHDLKYRQDKVGNVVIFAPGTNGYEDKDPIMLQGHMDMVAEKTSGSAHDFDKDPLYLYVDGDYITARDTTLGGDDGIAVAMILAILDSDDIPHPPIEAVITVNEEVGMLGAAALDCSDLKSKIMLNLDSEDEGILLAGCAGGVRLDVNIPIKRKEKLLNRVVITIDGLSGGHSGQEIQKGRANADKLAGRLLLELDKKVKYSLTSLEGGTKDNAIPRTCTIKLAVESESADKFEKNVKKIFDELKKTYSSTDGDMTISIKVDTFAMSTMVMSKKSKANTIYALNALPNGVIRMSPDVEGLPETSLNLGILDTTADSLKIGLLVRSSIELEKMAVVDTVKLIAANLDGTCEESGNYPGFKYRVDSPFRSLMADIWKEITGKDAKIEAIHAGIECGLFVDKIPDLDCVSIGPDMMDIHTPAEKLSISSTKRIWDYTLEILRRL